jgi:two-component sensor histidine kinase
MGHRLSNLFAITEGMIRGTARSAESPAAMAESLSGRLHALASANALVRRKVGDSGAIVEKKDLGDLVRAVVGPHAMAVESHGPPLRIEGPAVSCSDHASSGLALIIHEFATNASKYGALKNPGGRISISWEVKGAMLHLDWTESGGPPIESTPTRRGFGSMLAQRTVKSQFGGEIARDWSRQGLSITMTLSLARLAA